MPVRRKQGGIESLENIVYFDRALLIRVDKRAEANAIVVKIKDLCQAQRKFKGWSEL